jgi:hypothetical protein
MKIAIIHYCLLNVRGGDSPAAIRLHARAFAKARFHREFRAVLDDSLAEVRPLA